MIPKDSSSVSTEAEALEIYNSLPENCKTFFMLAYRGRSLTSPLSDKHFKILVDKGLFHISESNEKLTAYEITNRGR